MATVIGFEATLKKKCTCSKCTAIIEYTRNEMREEKYYDYSGGCDVYTVINCPNCGYEIKLK